MKKLFFLSMTLMMILSSCATILDGSSQNINLMSSSGDKVRAEVITKSGPQKVDVPSVLVVPRAQQDIMVTVLEEDNPCYNRSTQVAPSNLNYLFLVNIITGGTLGSITDALSGAMWKYDDSVVVQTNKKDSCKK